MSDELRERIGRLDPMHSGVPAEPTTTESSRDLLETIMSTSTKHPTEESGGDARRIWTVAVAAVAALVLAFAGGVTLFGDGEPGSAAVEAIELSTGENDVLASCIMFSPEELERVAEIAFEGTVTSVDGDTVRLGVDRWFRGGDDAGEVVLRAPQGLMALIDGIEFQVGTQYLISAQNGTVNYCGFSGLSTPELRAGFETAFPQG